MALALTSFWQWFLLFLIWVPLIMLWAAALIDIFGRHDMSGGAKVLWILVIFLLPWFGALLYVLARPRVVPA